MWIRRLLTELNVEGSSLDELLCDKQAATSISKNSVHRDGTKHVEVDRHFISEKIDNGIFNVNYIPTQLQVAEILTKALFRPTFE